jgi:hypothetical protein
MLLLIVRYSELSGWHWYDVIDWLEVFDIPLSDIMFMFLYTWLLTAWTKSQTHSSVDWRLWIQHETGHAICSHCTMMADIGNAGDWWERVVQQISGMHVSVLVCDIWRQEAVREFVANVVNARADRGHRFIYICPVRFHFLGSRRCRLFRASSFSILRI